MRGILRYRPAAWFLLTAIFAAGMRAQTEAKQTVTEFMGHKVILVEPKRDADGFAEEPYRVCFDVGPESPKPLAHCFTAPPSLYSYPPYGFDPELTPVDLGDGRSALLFTTWTTAGGSGSSRLVALLRAPDASNLMPVVELSEVSGYTFRREPSISDAPIFITADAEWGIGEAHHDRHRYILSVYVMDEDESYHLQDRYMTVRAYEETPNLDKPEIFDGEKPEILARLQRVKAEEERRKQAPQ